VSPNHAESKCFRSTRICEVGIEQILQVGYIKPACSYPIPITPQLGPKCCMHDYAGDKYFQSLHQHFALVNCSTKPKVNRRNFDETEFLTTTLTTIVMLMWKQRATVSGYPNPGTGCALLLPTMYTARNLDAPRHARYI